MLFMNFFKIVGDYFYYFSITLLLFTIVKKKSCIGISGRSQILFAISYATKDSEIWCDLFSVLSLVKVVFICFTYITVFLIFFAYPHTYQRKKDVFITEILVIPSFMLALWMNYDLTPIGIVQAFSVYLESVAILPQFCMILAKREVQKCLVPYLVSLGLYKVMYIFYWLLLYQNEGYYDPIVCCAGLLNTLLYVLALVEYFFIGISVVDGGNEMFLKRNIFLINTNEPLTDRLNLINNDQLDNEKPKSDEQAQVEKIYTI